MSTLYLTIGTTMISAVVSVGDVEKIIELDDGNGIPFAVYIYNKTVLFGRAAKEKGKTDPGNYYVHLLDIAGKICNDKEFEELNEMVPYHICRNDQDRCMLKVREEGKRVGKHPRDLISMIMSHIVDIVREKGFDINKVKVVYPLQCGSILAGELIEAAKMIRGIPVEIVAGECVASSCSGVSLDQSRCCVLLLHHRGRTTDFSVLRPHDQQFQVLFNYSCPNLGGEGSTHPIEAMTNLSEEGGAGELHCAEHSEEKVCFLSETSTTPACDAFLKETEESLKYVLEEIGELRQRITHVVLFGDGMNLHCLKERVCDTLNISTASMCQSTSALCKTFYVAMPTRHEVVHWMCGYR